MQFLGHCYIRTTICDGLGEIVSCFRGSLLLFHCLLKCNLMFLRQAVYLPTCSSDKLYYKVKKCVDYCGTSLSLKTNTNGPEDSLVIACGGKRCQFREVSSVLGCPCRGVSSKLDPFRSV